MARYKQKLIDKVLFHDLQPTISRITNPPGKPCDDKDGKKRNPKGVVKQRRGS